MDEGVESSFGESVTDDRDRTGSTTHHTKGAQTHHRTHTHRWACSSVCTTAAGSKKWMTWARRTPEAEFGGSMPTPSGSCPTCFSSFALLGFDVVAVVMVA
jgi:hypothetical protein